MISFKLKSFLSLATSTTFFFPSSSRCLFSASDVSFFTIASRMRCSSSSLCILESENVGIPSALSVSSLTNETLRRTTGTAFLSSFCPFFIDKSPTLFALVSLPSFEGAFHPTRRNSSSSLSICARVPLSNKSSAYFLPTDPGCLLFTEASVDEVIG